MTTLLLPTATACASSLEPRGIYWLRLSSF
jgi:hypothetical protein